MDSKGRTLWAVVVAAILSAAISGAVSREWTRATEDALREELALVRERLARIESPPTDAPPVKLVRAERVEVVAPDGTLRVVMSGSVDVASVGLSVGSERAALVVTDVASMLTLGGRQRARVSAMATRNRADVTVESAGSKPNSVSSVQMSSVAIGTGMATIEIDSGRPSSAEAVEADLSAMRSDVANGRMPRSPRVSLGVSPQGDDCEIALADARGRTRIAATVSGGGAPRLRLLDAEARTRLSLGRTALSGAAGDTETPEDAVVSFGEDGVVNWRTPR